MQSIRVVFSVATALVLAAIQPAEASRHHSVKHHPKHPAVARIPSHANTPSAIPVPMVSATPTPSPVPSAVAAPTIPLILPAPTLPSKDLKSKVRDYDNKLDEAQSNAKFYDINYSLSIDYKAQARKVHTYGFWENGVVIAMPGSPMAEQEADRLLDKSTQCLIKSRQGLDNCNVNLYLALKLWNGLLDDPVTFAGMKRYYVRGPHAVDASYIKKDYEGFGLENLRLIVSPEDRPALP